MKPSVINPKHGPFTALGDGSLSCVRLTLLSSKSDVILLQREENQPATKNTMKGQQQSGGSKFLHKEYVGQTISNAMIMLMIIAIILTTSSNNHMMKPETLYRSLLSRIILVLGWGK